VPLDRTALLASLAASTSAFGQLLACSDLDRAVASCPGWRLRDLAHHLGNVHAWAEAATRADAPPDLPAATPTGRDELTAWYAGTAASLVERLGTADPDEPCWHFGAKPRTVGWWVRRQAHETAVHLWDAQAAVGTPVALDPALAADGVDEVLDVFVPRQVRTGRTPPLPAAVRLVATDADLDRVLGDGEPVATVTGPASDLLLVLWKRVPLDRLEVEGDPAPVLSAGLVP
jgi:uncharacterized protein (TIGR03083 family)